MCWNWGIVREVKGEGEGVVRVVGLALVVVMGRVMGMGICVGETVDLVEVEVGVGGVRLGMGLVRLVRS